MRTFCIFAVKLQISIERRTIDTNVVGWTFVVDMFYRIFEQQGRGHLVAITSVGGLRGESLAHPGDII
ncbi:hypothetical protein [Prevotella sp. khp7]|uniref:hypothetical protein n=1 Tax=unclassified Prevotella TaxID=2638335 RepID=UPI00293708F5|nr:hypothetical protein [Prevotella sp. khp7]